MPVLVPQIEMEISDLLKETSKAKPEDAQKLFASGLASIISKAIKSADINVPANLVVVGVAGAVPVTGTASGVISGKLV